eukprot:SAG31_NODE_2588_length_5419_cov_15.402778_2_plen_576_part_00
MAETNIRRASQQCCFTSAVVACGGGPHIAATTLQTVCDGVVDVASRAALQAVLQFLRPDEPLAGRGSYESVVAPLITKISDERSLTDDVADYMQFIAKMTPQVGLVYTSTVTSAPPFFHPANEPSIDGSPLSPGAMPAMLVLGFTAEVAELGFTAELHQNGVEICGSTYFPKALVLSGPEHFWCETVAPGDVVWHTAEVDRQGTVDRTPNRHSVAEARVFNRWPETTLKLSGEQLKFVVFEKLQPSEAPPRQTVLARQNVGEAHTPSLCCVCTEAECATGLHCCVNCFQKHVRKKLAEPVGWQLSCPGCYGQHAHNYGAEELESLVDRGHMARHDKIKFLERESTAKTNAMLGKEGLPRCRRLVDSGNGRQKFCNAHIEETPDAYAFCSSCLSERCKHCGWEAKRTCKHEDMLGDEYVSCPHCAYAQLRLGGAEDECWARRDEGAGCGGVTCPGCYMTFNTHRVARESLFLPPIILPHLDRRSPPGTSEVWVVAGGAGGTAGGGRGRGGRHGAAGDDCTGRQQPARPPLPSSATKRPAAQRNTRLEARLGWTKRKKRRVVRSGAGSGVAVAPPAQ